MLKALCLSVWLGLSLVSGAQAASVVFLNPGNADETFWVSYSRFMQGAAQNLGMSLRVEYSGRDRQRVLHQARQALQGPQRADYLVLVNEQYVAPQILRMAQGSGVKLVIVNKALTADQKQLLDARADSGWVASLVADDEQAGYLMLTDLLRQHGPVAPGQSLDLLAFSGAKNTPAARLREQGLYRALAEHPEVRLRQVVYGAWSRQRAVEQATQLFKRYPQAALVWSANDEMALGAMRALHDSGRVPGQAVLFSAVNSSPDILQARLQGRLTTLVAGHFTLGGWAMVLIHDDAKGVAIDAHGGRDRQQALFQLIDTDQAKRLLAPTLPVDFRALSAVGKPASYRYPFSLQLLLR